MRRPAGVGLGGAVAGGQPTPLPHGRRPACGGLELGGLTVELPMPAGEQLGQPPVDPGQLPAAALAGRPPGQPVAEALELGGELAGIDRFGGGGELVDRPRIHRQIAALAEGQVEHEGVAVQLRIRWPARLSGDLAGGTAGVMGEHRHPQLTGSVDLLAVDRGAAGRHPRLQLLQRDPDRRQVRPLQLSPFPGGHEGQQRRHRLRRAQVAVDPRHMTPTRGDPLAGDRLRPGHMRGLDQPLARQRLAAGGQPPEPDPVQPRQAQPRPQPPVQPRGRLGGGAVGTQVVVGLLATTDQVAPQVTGDPGDRLGLELPRHKHHSTPQTRSARTRPANPKPLTGNLTAASPPSASLAHERSPMDLSRRPR